LNGPLAVISPEIDHWIEQRDILVHNCIMYTQQVLRTLREHELELKAAGIVHLRIFGSVARGESSSSSDVDLMAEFDKSKRLTLVKIGSLQCRLTDMLGTPVELSSSEWMREPVRSRALREAVLAF